MVPGKEHYRFFGEGGAVASCNAGKADGKIFKGAQTSWYFGKGVKACSGFLGCCGVKSWYEKMSEHGLRLSVE